MNKDEYISRIQTDLQATLDDYRYNNHKNQIFARKLSAQFNSTYDESLLWSRALYISSTACVLLIENQNIKLALNSLRNAAEVYENIGLIAQGYDKHYAVILSSLCYDLAGYQANSRCLVRQIGEYSFESARNWENLDSTNYLLNQVCCILLKHLPLAKLQIKHDFDHDLGIKLFNSAVNAWYRHALDGDDTNYSDLMKDTYRYYLNSSNVVISHLLFLLRARLVTYKQRSIWQILSGYESIRGNAQWTKYIRLLTHDFYDRDNIKPHDRRVSKFEFWTSQIRAIENGLLNNHGNFIIQMPTSAGKTFIAELSIVNFLISSPGKKCIYVSPFRALTNEKENELSEYLSKLGYSVSALSGSYEVDEFQNIILEDTDILVATPEKIDLLLRVNPNYFESVALLVIDEGHIVGDISARSSLMEFLIIRLRIKTPTVRILFISAVMPPENANEYSMWLNQRADFVIRSLLHLDSPVGEEWEPTRKLIGAFSWDRDNGRIEFRAIETEDEQSRVRTGAFIPAFIRAKQYGGIFPQKDKKGETSVALAYEFSKQGNCLIFCAQARETVRVGKSMLDLLGIIDREGESSPEHFRVDSDRESYYFARKWFGEDHTITQCLRRGVGIHYGDLPEPVRRGVESDYNSGNLKILISTNTVGQGLNFPIKYLIIHSTLISQSTYISVRDFWNIVGRAGRAGKETEGQIIFNIKSPTDRRSYERYTDRSNIEKAFSIFFNVLNWLADRRITDELFLHNLQILSEPYLLSLLIEETVDTNDDEIIAQIINTSLFKVQAEVHRVDIQPLHSSFRQIISQIREQVPEEMKTAFAQTGLILKSNLAIANYIDIKRDELALLVAEDNYNALLGEIFALFDLNEVDEMSSEKLNRLQLRPTETLVIAVNWIEGIEIDVLQTSWIALNREATLFHNLISDGFYYRYPWGIASFITILCAKINVNRDTLSHGVANLSTYVKFGVNNPTACLAKGLGIKNRDVALLLSNKANYLLGRDFITWMANITLEDIAEMNFNRYDQSNILNVAVKLTPKRYDEARRAYSFYIRGVPYHSVRKAASLNVKVGDELRYHRDFTNAFDPYAVKIYGPESEELGFVPREYSKPISVDLDIDQAEYIIQVIDIEQQTGYNRITVRMEKRAE